MKAVMKIMTGRKIRRRVKKRRKEEVIPGAEVARIRNRDETSKACL
jgi:hypothetical protein